MMGVTVLKRMARTRPVGVSEGGRVFSRREGGWNLGIWATREKEAVRKDIGKSKKCDLKRGKKIISPCIRDGRESWQQESVPPCQARGQFMVCFSSRASQFVGQIFELQRSPLLCAPGLVKFVPAAARLFCLALPGSFLNILAQNKVDLCTYRINC